ncbi:MAG: glycosyltransferase family 2 protein, partial [Rhodobacterales bacterium]
LGGCPVLQLRLPEGTDLTIGFGGTVEKITPTMPEPTLLAGTNAIAVTRNGESAATVLQWLNFNAKYQGLEAAVIIDRDKPNYTNNFDKEFQAGLANLDQTVDVIILRSPLPLGKPDLPDESHPFCTPGAPGKDRMEIPEIDPRTAPLGILHCYEILRDRYLSKARAVANIDVHDLIMDEQESSIFDRAVTSEQGAIALLGTQSYPWRVRKSEKILFADHIYVQFDAGTPRRKWCIAPAQAAANAVWRMNRIGNVTLDDREAGHFYRFMNVRHRADAVSKIVPKSSLVEDARLLHLAKTEFGHRPVRAPKQVRKVHTENAGRRAIVTTMKNEGPFILEWLAFHRVVGFDSFLVYTNDCTDGTDTLLDLLQTKGFLQHRNNPFRESGLKPQHAALAAAGHEPIITEAQWAVCIDVDEFINIKTGDGTLDALFAAVPDANLISMTWRLFGNSDIEHFTDDLITRNFTRCAPEYSPKPHQAWGFKTMFQNTGIFKKLGVHRPKGLNSQLVNHINWVNGSGKTLPETMFRNAWRSTAGTYGYDLVQLNHYTVRSTESFLVKRDRGRVNHVDRDQGLAYWFRMNNNGVEDISIQRMIPRVEQELAQMKADPDIAAAHDYSVRKHREKIDELCSTEKYAKFYAELKEDRMKRLSRLHAHFGAGVFLSGPTCVPDEIVARDPDEKFFFTVEAGETQH